MAKAFLVQVSSLSLERLVPLGRKALDRNVAERADSWDLQPPSHHMLCIAAIDSVPKDRNDAAKYLGMFHAGMAMVASEYDSADILATSGMPSIVTDTVERGYQFLYLTGTLDQWRLALLRGCSHDRSGVQQAYNSVYSEFDKVGLARLFEMKKVTQTSGLFLLEYRR